MKRSVKLMLGVTAVLSLAAAPAGRYVLTTDTVTDTKSGLMWQRTQSATPYTSQAAASAYCYGLVLAGYSDWRPPTVKELMTLVDAKGYPLLIDATAFPNASNAWTSTVVANDSTQGWVVSFGNGSPLAVGNTNAFEARARCVR